MQTSPKRKRIELTRHAVLRATDRYQVERSVAEQFVVADIEAAFACGRVSPNKPRWARATAARHPMPGQTYAWDADRSHAYVVDVSGKAQGSLRVITCLAAVAA